MKFSSHYFASISLIVACAASSCGKHKDDDAAPGAPKPNMQLVASDFKNTAHSGAEVAAQLKQFESTAKSTTMSPKTSAKTNISAMKTPELASSQALDSDRVSAFLSGAASKAMEASASSDDAHVFPPPSGLSPASSKATLDNGSDCASQLSTLDSTYTSTATALSTLATNLEKLDKSLPEGLTRGASTDQFAVTYTADLSKFSDQVKKSAQQQSTSTNISPLNFGGQFTIGAGANNTGAIIGFGLLSNFNASQDQNSLDGTANGSMALSASTAKKLISFNLDVSSNLNLKSGSNAKNVHGKASTNIEIQAGDSPAIQAIFNVSGNMKFDPQSKNSQITDDDHSVSANVKIAKLASNDVEVNYSFTTDSDKQTGKITLTNDPATGHCVIKNADKSAPVLFN